jgi:hypothetical protein
VRRDVAEPPGETMPKAAFAETPATSHTASVPRSGSLLQAGLSFASYLIASVWLCRDVLSGMRRSVIGLSLGDDSIFTWWLTYTPWALLHGKNPLVTDMLNYPSGVNGMWNTSVPLLGLLGTPITYTAGPTATFNIMMMLGPPASGLLTFIVLRRYLHPAAAWLTGAMYAFSPFVLAHLIAGHLNLVWNILPPLMVYFVDEIIVRQQRSPVRLGVLLGLVLTIQAGLYTQTIGLGAAVVAVVVTVMGLHWRDQVRLRLRYAATAVGIGAGLFLVLCAFPLYMLVRGPHRPTGSLRDQFYFVGDLANIVVPTPWNYALLGTGDRAADMRLNGAEQGFYVGVVALVACFVALAIARSAFAWLIATSAAAAAVLALGPQLVIFNDPHGPRWLPFRLIAHLPLLENIESVRFTVFVGFAAATLVGVLLDRALRSSVRTWQAGGVALATVAALTWMPAVNRYPVVSPIVAPAFFTDGSVTEAIAEGSVVRTVPRAAPELPGHAAPMTWQAWTLMHYKSRGGYFLGSEGGVNVNAGVPDAFDVATDSIGTGGLPPALGTPEFTAVQAALTEHPVDYIIVVPLAGTGDQQVLLTFVTAVTGVAGEENGGAYLFRLTR